MKQLAQWDWCGNPQVIESWSEIAVAIRYQELSPARQHEAREEFFHIVIQPQLDSADATAVAAARAEFEREVERYLAAEHPSQAASTGYSHSSLSTALYVG